MINKKILESINRFTDNANSIIEKADMEYYCTRIKPLYIVRL